MERGNRLDSTFNGKLRIEWAKDRIIFVDDDGFTKLLIGPRTDGRLAVELAQAGVDVLNASDDELIWSSRFNSFKIVHSGVITLSTSGSPTGASPELVSYAHGLSDVPVVLAFTDDGGTRRPLPILVHNVTTGAIGFHIYTVADATHVKFIHQRWASDVAIDYDIRFYVLVETAQ